MTESELQEINDSVTHPVTVADTSDADLVIADGEGNTYLSVINGHVVTANFDSSNIQTSSGGSVSGKKISQLAERTALTGTEMIPFADSGENGYFKASALAVAATEHPVKLLDTDAADLIIADESLNAIATFSGGHISTSSFSSADLTARVAALESSQSSGSSSSDSSSSGSSSSASESLSLSGRWVSLGTSISYGEGTTKGYQAYVQEKITFGGYENKAVAGSSLVDLSNSLSSIPSADYYTIEHGTNDYGHSTALGSLSDFTGNTGNSTFYGAYRKVIDRIYALNPQALIMLVTPVKTSGPVWSLPDSCYTAINGHTLEDFADAVKEIAKYCSLPVADLFGEANLNMLNHAAGFYNDNYLHPNANGHKRMAAVVYRKFLTFVF